MPNYDEMIGKSLDELEQISNQFSAPNTNEEVQEGVEEEVSKAQGDEDLAPKDVSDNAPEPEGEEGQEEEAPEEAPEEPEATDGDDEPVEDEGEEEEEEYEKSLDSAMRSEDNVKKALEVSEFLDSLVKGISDIIEGQRSDLSKSLEAQEQHNEILAKSFQGIAKSQKVVLETTASLMKSVEAMSGRMEKIERQPKVRKSVSSNTQALEKSFQPQETNPPVGQSNQMNKSMALTKLTQAVETGQGNYTSDILALESTGDFNSMSNEAKSYLGING